MLKTLEDEKVRVFGDGIRGLHVPSSPVPVNRDQGYRDSHTHPETRGIGARTQSWTRPRRDPHVPPDQSPKGSTSTTLDKEKTPVGRPTRTPVPPCVPGESWRRSTSSTDTLQGPVCVGTP